MADARRNARSPEPRTFGLALRYVGRAMKLRCPVCGRSRIFVPLLRTRSLMDWFNPLDGCPRCGYPYEREPGYFLFSQWVLNFGFVSFVGLTSYVLLEMFADVTLPVLLLAVGLPAPILGIAIARHAKAAFIALDHFFDPFEAETESDDGGGGDGDLRVEPPPDGGGAPAALRDDDVHGEGLRGDKGGVLAGSGRGAG